MGDDNSKPIPPPDEIPLADRQACLNSVDLAGIVAHLNRKATKVVCLCGAGISVSAGIPDFRTPGTGLYDNLARFDLPTVESVFTLDYFRSNPKPFCMLAKEMFPGRHKPTPTHAFMRLLQEKGLLHKVYTQNIDTLERVAGIRPELLVEAHGSFGDVRCTEKDCGRHFPLQEYRDRVDANDIPRCGTVLDIPPPVTPPSEQELSEAKEILAVKQKIKAEVSKKFDWKKMCDAGVAVVKAQTKVDEIEAAISKYPGLLEAWQVGPKTRVCGGLIKSAIVFFGEPVDLGDTSNMADADLLIIMGTSLQVMPFAGMIGKVGPLCPRILLNRELVGHLDQDEPPMFFPGDASLRVGSDDNYRDVFEPGDCDSSVATIAKELGWTVELLALHWQMQEREADAAWQELVDLQTTKIRQGELSGGVGVFL